MEAEGEDSFEDDFDLPEARLTWRFGAAFRAAGLERDLALAFIVREVSAFSGAVSSISSEAAGRAGPSGTGAGSGEAVSLGAAYPVIRWRFVGFMCACSRREGRESRPIRTAKVAPREP